MRDVREAIREAHLYGVTDLRSNDEDVLLRVRQACLGGADIIQLRSKVLSDGELYRIGFKIKAITHDAGSLFVVNDRIDLALLLDADGVHLGQDDIPLSRARTLAARAGKDLIWGISTHSVEQAKVALQESPDYLGVGPVFQTPTKPDYRPVGLGLVKAVSSFSQIPFFCIGGINLDNIDSLVQAGGSRVAVVRALIDSEDPYESARKFKLRLTQNV